MNTLLQDIRYSARTLLKNPAFTAVIVLTLALGVGANTAIFSMVDWLLLRPLPVKDPQQITVLAFQQNQGPVLNQLSMPEYHDIRNLENSPFSDVFAYLIGMDGLSENGKPDRILTSYVSGNYFTALGLNPAAGRLILPSEGETSGADPVIVLAYSYWQTRYGGDPSVVGRKVSIDGHPLTIVGVAPKGFHGVQPFIAAQAFMPLNMAFIEGYPSDYMTNRQNRAWSVLARLRENSNMRQANASLAVLSQRLTQAYPKEEKDFNFQAYPELESRPNPDPKRSVAIISGLFLGLAGLVLLLACANVANILLVRATVREREMAIRAALGAARNRLIRQMLTESILLALIGGLAGILLGRWGSGAIGSIPIQVDLPVNFDFSLDWRVFTYALGAALLTGIIVGIIPAFRASRSNLATILHEGGRGVVGGKQRMRNALVAAQVGGSLMLLIVAGLFTRSLGEAQKSNLGFDPSHILIMTMDPSELGYTQVQGREFYQNLLDRVRALPGVESSTLASNTPMGYYGNADGLTIEGYQPPPGQAVQVVTYNAIASDYFKTLRIPMVRGRAIASADDDKAPYTAVINEAMAKTYWPNQEPIGRHFVMNSDTSHTIEIVGIAKDARYQGVTGPVRAYFYVPLMQHYALASLATLQVRTLGAPEPVISVVERAVQSLAPDLPFFDVKTMTQGLNTLNGLLFYKLGAGLAGVFGALGLVLAVVGVYGVISYATNQKTHEIGIRMALGAQQIDVLRMILQQGLTIVAIGLGVGLLAAFAAARFVGQFLTVSATDPLTYIIVSSFLTLIALLACYFPARRAMRVDPMVALRYE